MQMYRVQFQTHHKKALDRGVVLVCADNQESATDMVRSHLKLPGSITQFKIERVRPAVYVLEHKEVLLNEPKPSLRNHGMRK